MESVEDANGNVTTYQYDTLGRRKKRTRPDGKMELYSYDLRDNLMSMTDESGSQSTFFYDDLSRLLGASTPANGTVPGDAFVVTYDASGRLLSADDPDSTLDFTYDDAGRLTTQTSSTNGGAPVTLAYDYDLAGNRTEIADSFGGAVSMTYDGAGRLGSLTTSAGPVSIGHDLSGRLATVLFPRNGSAEYDYDANGRLATVGHFDSQDAILASYTMGYDLAGNITSITDGAPSRVREFGYDELHRLRSERTLPDVPALYDYDAVGNRTSSPVSTTYVHDALNRVTSDDDFTYAYDEDGNLTSRTGGGQTTTYRWDVRIIGIDFPGGGSASYRYDAFGGRIEKTTGTSTTRYVYDGEDIALETDGAGALQRRYRHGDGIDQPLVAEDVVANESYFFHADHLGSIRLVTDEAGEAVSEYDYDAYGRRTAIAESFEQPYAYTGREWDEESGLYYYRARYYDPAQGRFLSEKPGGFDTGSLNLYGYRTNPVEDREIGAKITIITIWRPVGWGRSSFGHVSTTINNTTFSFSPDGMFRERKRKYLKRNDFRHGDGLELNLTPDQERALKECLQNVEGGYNTLTNNCSGPPRDCLSEIGIDLGPGVLPIDLGDDLLEQPDLVDDVHLYPPSSPQPGTGAPWTQPWSPWE